MKCAIDISGTKSGTHTNVREALDNHMVEWAYDKPVFSFSCEDTTFAELSEDVQQYGVHVSQSSPAVIEPPQLDPVRIKSSVIEPPVVEPRLGIRRLEAVRRGLGLDADWAALVHEFNVSVVRKGKPAYWPTAWQGGQGTLSCARCAIPLDGRKSNVGLKAPTCDDCRTYVEKV